MNEGPADPTQPSGSGSARTPPGSRFEDLTNFEVPVDAVARGHRTAILITAAVVLFAGALFAVLYVVLLLPFASSEKGSSVSGALVGFLLVYGSLQAVAGVLVLLLRQSGRWLGIILAVVGIGLGISRASSTPASGLVTILLNAFVIYALASSGPAFRRG
jgi:prepilin signal peptidase PulO-like enzyme (type II secretory pathway)